jgi:dTMP kinase
VRRKRKSPISLESPDNGDRAISPAAGTPAASRRKPSSAQTEQREDLGGALIVLEGTDGSGRSTQIALLTEYLESQGFAVQTMGLRRSSLIARDIDQLVAENTVTRLTLALMYATDFYDQLENRIIPALRSGMVVLADRYIFTLIARGVVRGLRREYLHGIYDKALRPDLTFWIDVSPQVAFNRLFKKSQAISYWEAGRDMSLSNDLYESFLRYQTMIRREFDYLSRRHEFIRVDAEQSVAAINKELRRRVAAYLRIRSIRYQPSRALAHLWR